jgi:hypothetical protein
MLRSPSTPKTIQETLRRICDLSIDTYYNPYKTFQWPDTLPEKQWWMSRELMTTYGTDFEEVPAEQLMSLSKWESIHFYSLNVHGIRELLLEVVKRVHTPGFELESEFFHHFLGEENEHMWFFASFCLRYGATIYPDKKLKLQIAQDDPEVECFLVFSRILIFEEIVDYFNLRMGRDESLHPLIRQINSIHHQDESRHIAFGRELVKLLYDKLHQQHPPELLTSLAQYLQRFMVASVQSLYNPAVYRDAGFPEPYQMRAALLAHPARKQANAKILSRTVDYYRNNGIIFESDSVQ